MQLINDLLESISRGIDEREEKPRQQKYQNQDWEAAKQYIDSLSPNYSHLVAKNGIRVKEVRSGRLNRKSATLGTFKGMGYEFVEYTKPDNSVQAAWYVIFNDRDQLTYKRAL